MCCQGRFGHADEAAVKGFGSWRLRPEVDVHLEVDDRSAFGSPLTTRADVATRALFARASDAAITASQQSVTVDARRLLAEVVASDAFREVGSLLSNGRFALHEVVRYPDRGAVHWSKLIVEDGRHGVELNVAPADWPEVHQVVAELAGPGIPTTTSKAPHELTVALESAGLLTTDRPPRTPLPAAGVTFLGHNIVLIRTKKAAVLADPLLRAPRDHYPSRYRPLRLVQLGSLDAVLITHSHPDHFAPGTLVQLPPELPVVVPKVERETLLAVAMGERLRQLGHHAIVEVAPGDHLQVGDIDVEVLPFYGEQPTDGPLLHPEIRNVGVTYLVRTPEMSVGLVADAGRDHAGDIRDVASAARASFGPVDILFAGYRGWHTYPVQYLQSSVARYLLFVPPELWAARQRIMNDADDAIDLAERWDARILVPYADGGTPWFWELGLGPRLDDEPYERIGVDPYPERVVDAAARRVRASGGGWHPSAVRVELLRAHDSLVDGRPGRAPARVRPSPNGWPFVERVLPELSGQS